MQILITVKRLLTGDYDSPVDDAAVVVDDQTGTVLAAGPRGSLLSGLDDEGDRVHLDFPDATALPGLINAHVHLCFEAGVDPAGLADTRTEQLDEVMRRHARTLLEQGVTTTRDLGDRLGATRRLRDDPTGGRGSELLPRIQLAGPPITPPRGHCWFLGGEVEPERPALEAQVDALAEMGVDWIKVMVSGGHSTAGGAPLWESQFSRDQLGAIVGAARRRGLPVAAHAHGVDAVADAVAAGVDTIEHCSLIASGDLDVRFDADLATSIADAGIAVCLADLHSVDHYEGITGDRGIATGLVDRIRFLADHGVTLIAGTDAGINGFDDSTRSLVNHQPTFTPAEVLTSATTAAARALGIGESVGRLERGYAADILVVDGDPLDDLTALRDVDAVFVGGRRLGAEPLTP